MHGAKDRMLTPWRASSRTDIHSYSDISTGWASSASACLRTGCTYDISSRNTRWSACIRQRWVRSPDRNWTPRKPSAAENSRNHCQWYCPNGIIGGCGIYSYGFRVTGIPCIFIHQTLSHCILVYITHMGPSTHRHGSGVYTHTVTYAHKHER